MDKNCGIFKSRTITGGVMKVLVIGSGGREDALARKIAQSPFVDAVFCAPGNAGTAMYATNLNVPATDIARLIEAVESNGIYLTFVGPEDPLTLGIVDAFEEKDLAIFGPRKNAAILEGSKSFTKELLKKYEIPTAAYAVFTEYIAAIEYVRTQKFPLVIKADGLAAGKGVMICQDFREAENAILDMMMDRKFGDAGTCIVIEEFLDGEEASCISFIDKNGHVLMLEFSQDHKRVGDLDTGPNTGGMGAYSPAPVVTAIVESRTKEMIQRTVDAMIAEGTPFTGVLYAGLMIKDEQPKILEYNVRFGDPETQPLMMRMKSDIVPIIMAALDGNLDRWQIEWDPRPAVCITLAAHGYPESPKKGGIITGIAEAEEKGATVYFGGVRKVGDDLTVSGGRVLYPTALGDNFFEAQRLAYLAANKIECPDLFRRNDIADRALNR